MTHPTTAQIPKRFNWSSAKFVFLIFSGFAVVRTIGKYQTFTRIGIPNALAEAVAVGAFVLIVIGIPAAFIWGWIRAERHPYLVETSIPFLPEQHSAIDDIKDQINECVKDTVKGELELSKLQHENDQLKEQLRLKELREENEQLRQQLEPTSNDSTKISE